LTRIFGNGSSQARPILLSYVSDWGICYHTNQALIASWGQLKMLLILIMFLPLWDNFADVFFLELHANWESITFALTESFVGKNLLTDLKLRKRDTS
jgi:hypothetical protein